METFVAIISVFLNGHNQIRFFGEFPNENACLAYVQNQVNIVAQHNAEVVARCPTLSEIHSQFPAAFIEEPST